MLLSPELALGRVADRAVVIRFDDILIFVIFIGWLAKLAVFKELGLLRRTPLNGVIFAYIFVCVVSTFIMLIGGDGSFKRSSFYLLKYFEYFVLYFLVVNNISSLKQAKVFVFLMITTCFLVSAYGLYSYFKEGMRATAPFEGLEGEANTLAGYLSFIISIALGVFLYSLNRRLKVALFVVVSFALLTLVFTLSRSGWITFIVAYISLIFLSKRNKAVLVAGFVIMAVLAPLLAPRAVQERVSETFVKGGKTYKMMGRQVVIDESGSARLEAWKTGYNKLLKKPLFGYGIPGASVVDNQYARVMIETGVLGLFVFFLLLWRIFMLGRYAVAFTQGDPFGQGVTVGFLAGFFGLLLHGFTAATFILIRIMEPFWFLVAIVALLPELIKSVEVAPESFAGT